VLLGLGLRLINLAQQPLWGDEVLSLDISSYLSHIPQLLRYLAAVEVHPPLYYIILHYWVNWFGTGTLFVRLPSVVLGLGCIILSYYWGKIIFSSKKIGLIAALIMAVLPFQLEFSQEARPYIFFCFFGMLASLSLWQYYRTKYWPYWIGYILSCIVGLYLHYSYLFILFGLATWGLVEIYQTKNRGREFLIWLIAHAIIVLGFSFWLVPFLLKIAAGDQTIFGWVRSSFNKREPYFFEYIFSQLIWLTKEQALSRMVLTVAFMAKACLLAGFGWLIVQIQKKDQMQTWWPAIFTLWIAVIPFILFFFSPQSVSYTSVFEKHIIFISVPLVLLISWLIGSLPRKYAIISALIFFTSLAPYAVAILGNDAQWDPDYNLAADASFINKNFEPGDIVIVSVAIVRTDLTHYLSDNIPVYSMLPINYYFNDLDDWSSRHLLGYIENEYQSRITATSESSIIQKLDTLNELYHPKRVWLYGFDSKQYAMEHWFTDRGWRHAYQSIADISLVDLYSK
jgi:uncharacterized membrane protein